MKIGWNQLWNDCSYRDNDKQDWDKSTNSDVFLMGMHLIFLKVYVFGSYLDFAFMASRSRVK